MERLPLLSLCIPTNGIIEWVFPVLDSIYAQNVDEDLFEVVITDNGNNPAFQKKMTEYEKCHSNINYRKTKAILFLNEIASYNLAKGKLIKFVNHRTKLIDGSINKLISYVEKYCGDKPVIYFSNGVLSHIKGIAEYDNFDKFVCGLSYFSSWSTGMAIWKSDFEKIPENTVYNELFPHSTILFMERNKNKYIIDNEIIMKEIPAGHAAKGKYDLFYAFGIEYPGIICDLLRDKSISAETCRRVLNNNLDFVVSLFWSFCVKKEKCSYDLAGLDCMFGVFYKKANVYCKVFLHPLDVVAKKIKKILK